MAIPRGKMPSGRFVHDVIAAASFSASLLAARRVGCAVPSLDLDPDLDPAKIATAVTSDKHVRLNSEPDSAWAELSGLWPCNDGWVCTHANHPHHRDALLSLSGDTCADKLMLALHAMIAADVGSTILAAGGATRSGFPEIIPCRRWLA